MITFREFYKLHESNTNINVLSNPKKLDNLSIHERIKLLQNLTSESEDLDETEGKINYKNLFKKISCLTVLLSIICSCAGCDNSNTLKNDTQSNVTIEQKSQKSFITQKDKDVLREILTKMNLTDEDDIGFRKVLGGLDKKNVNKNINDTNNIKTNNINDYAKKINEIITSRKFQKSDINDIKKIIDDVFSEKNINAQRLKDYVDMLTSLEGNRPSLIKKDKEGNRPSLIKKEIYHHS